MVAARINFVFTIKQGCSVQDVLALSGCRLPAVVIERTTKHLHTDFTVKLIVCIPAWIYQ